MRQEVLDDNISSGHARALCHWKIRGRWRPCEEIIDKNSVYVKPKKVLKLLKTLQRRRRQTWKSVYYCSGGWIETEFATKVKISGKRTRGRSSWNTILQKTWTAFWIFGIWNDVGVMMNQNNYHIKKDEPEETKCCSATWFTSCLFWFWKMF